MHRLELQIFDGEEVHTLIEGEDMDAVVDIVFGGHNERDFIAQAIGAQVVEKIEELVKK